MPPGARPKVMLVFHDRRWYLLIDDEVVWDGPGEVEIVVQPPRYDFMRERVGDLHGSYIYRSGPTEVRLTASWYIDPRSMGALLIHEHLYSSARHPHEPEFAVMVGAELNHGPVAWLFRSAIIESVRTEPEMFRRQFRSAPLDDAPGERQQFSIYALDPSTVFQETSARVAKAQAALPPATKALPR